MRCKNRYIDWVVMKNINQFYFFLWLAALTVVFIGSLYPIDQFPKNTPEISDKFLHLVAYFCIAGLGLMASKNMSQRCGFVFVSLIFGITIEFLQPMTGRRFEVADMLANLSGIVIAIFMNQIFLRLIIRK